MSRLSELLRQVALKDERLAADLKRETDALAERRSFGLNFERHVPEAVELPGRPVRKNDKVRILPARGEKPTAENERLWRVDSVYTEDGQRWANMVSMDDAAEVWSVTVEDLVVVAEFRDPIYPGLVSAGKVELGAPDKPYHAVINAENYHALQALLFTHRAEVDVIYIDPPYNTGNDGWIYNDKYVASDDLYKHSKWLAFMERRLLLAKELLKPSGVIMVSIGDEEQPRLRLGAGDMWQLLGRKNRNKGALRVCDFRRARGFYVLFDDYGAEYVGLAAGAQGLGQRLKTHHAQRDGWSRFCWFSFDDVADWPERDGWSRVAARNEVPKVDTRTAVGE